MLNAPGNDLMRWCTAFGGLITTFLLVVQKQHQDTLSYSLPHRGSEITHQEAIRNKRKIR